MSAFLAKNQHFLAIIVSLRRVILWELCLRFFSSVFNFCKIKGHCYWKCKFYRLCVRNPASELLQIRKTTMTSQFANMKICLYDIVNYLWRCFVSFVNFSYWYKFHRNIVIGFGVMTIYFYKGLTRNPNIGNTPIWVLPNEGKLGIPNLAWIRSSRPELFLRKGVLKICSKFTGKYPCRSVISMKLQSNYIEITLRHGCFCVNLLHIFRTLFTRNTSEWLLVVFAVY